ncbi:SUKH-4 family immunity protein [Lipingzhangella halophila]|uniref:SUKH-4 family immunity protein n=1 Tax=Lipingzhangella halophila TaxID=1783352 RepID=UPI0035E44646
MRESADREVTKAREAPLWNLVDPGGIAEVGHEAVSQWRVPEADIAALLESGLPEKVTPRGYFFHAPQSGAAPGVPISGGDYYGIGFFGRNRIAVESGSGVVYRFTSEGVGLLLNSSVCRYVECVWRWREVVPVMVGLANRVRGGGQDGFFEEKIREMVGCMSGTDPVAANSDPFLWKNIVFDS